MNDEQKQQNQQQHGSAMPVQAVTALDKDVDEELLLEIPPPPPRPRHPPSPMHQNRTPAASAVVAAAPRNSTLLPPTKQQQQQQQHKKSFNNRESTATTSTSSNKPSRIESFHNAVLTNMKDVEQLRRSQNSLRRSSSGRNSPLDPFQDATTPPSLLTETIRDISIAAVSTMEALKKLAGEHSSQTKNRSSFVPPATVACVPMPADEDDDDEEEEELEDVLSPPRKHTATAIHAATTHAELTSLFSKWCGTTASASNHHSAADNDASWEPHMRKMQQAVNKVMDVNKLQRDIWRFTGTASEAGNKTPASRRRHFQGGGDDDDDDEHERSGGAANWAANLLGMNQNHFDDDNTVGTFDTWQEENSQLRRLGSWGTINSGFTSGTGGTFGTYELGGSPASSAEDADIMRLLMEDDHGHAIDPILLERTQKLKQQRQQQQQKQQQKQHPAGASDTKKVKRKKRRTKVVQFDYPPIKSLRQYIRPDPEDLPNLFFTEQELDQIEEDRYCTMSTDDIEIVAVSSKLSSSEDNDEDYPKNAPQHSQSRSTSGEIRENPSPEHSEPHAPGMKPVKGRSCTPHRRRPTNDAGSSEEDAEGSPSSSRKKDHGRKSPSTSSGAKSPRLVKGVQIYLRERSTGA
jgi:hypothetical protein